MAKVSDMIGDYCDPRGNSGFAVDHDIAARIAGDMRQIMCMDLDEIDIGLKAYLFNIEIEQEEMIAAWELLNPGERRAWREFVRLGKC